MNKLKPLNKNKINKVITNNDSNLSNILNKASLNQTNTTDFSISQEKSQKNTNIKKIKLPSRNNDKSNKKISKPLISISIQEDEDKKLTKEKSKLKQNIKNKVHLPTNVNSFYHLIYDNMFGSCESLNWALGLRLANKKIKNLDDKKSRNEPTFYLEDEKKYIEKSNKYSKPLLNELNPDFSKIQHLIQGRTNGNINYSQFSFSSCLRDFTKIKNKNANIEQKEKNWKLTPLPDIKSYNYKVKCLSPITTSGINNFKKLENYIPKNYEYLFEDTKVGNDKIKKKILINNRSYTISGFGDNLSERTYNNKFRDINIFANKEILSKETNPISKFELGLRNYGFNKIIKKDNSTKIMNKRKKTEE